jgi:hypothetical protein
MFMTLLAKIMLKAVIGKDADPKSHRAVQGDQNNGPPRALELILCLMRMEFFP